MPDVFIKASPVPEDVLITVTIGKVIMIKKFIKGWLIPASVEMEAWREIGIGNVATVRAGRRVVIGGGTPEA